MVVIPKGGVSVKNDFMEIESSQRTVTGSLAAYQALEALRTQLGMSKRAFVMKYLGLLNPQNYTHWSKMGVPMGVVLAVAKEKGFNASALLDGRLVSEPSVVEESNVVPAVPPQFRVPVISWVRAGNFESMLDQRALEDITQWVYLSKQPGPRAFGLIVKGPSMEPRFQDGDYLVVDSDVEWADGDFVILGNGNEEATFKQIVRDGGDWWARPLNPQFSAKKLDPTCRVIGRVIWHQKPGTSI
jgi:SOS-response transcriptional repressor LexA